jgi:putative inorganic carbon (HCO3(-)) transporter
MAWLSTPATVSIGAIAALFTSYLLVNQRWSWLLLIGGVVAVLLLIAMRPSTALVIVFAFLPFHSLLTDVFSRTSPLVAIIKDVLMVAIILSLLLYHLGQRRKLYLNPTLIMFLALAAISSIYVAVSPSWLRALLDLRFLTLYPLIALVAANSLETPIDLRRILRVVAAVSLLVIAYGILQFLYPFDIPLRAAADIFNIRMTRFGELGIISTFASRPSFGGYLIPIFLLFFQVRLWESRRSSWLFRILALGATLLCLMLTFSRTSWIAFLVGLFVLMFFRHKLKASIALVALSSCLVIFYATQFYKISPALTEAFTSSESFGVRLDYWPRVFRLVATRPFGTGLGNVGGPHIFEDTAGQPTDVDYNPSSETIQVTDNTYLKLFVQGGFPLLLVFLGLIATVLHLAYSVLKRVRDPWLRDVAIWAVASFAALLTIFTSVDYMEAAPSISVYWLAVGALCCVQRLIDEKRTRNVAAPITVQAI